MSRKRSERGVGVFKKYIPDKKGFFKLINLIKKNLLAKFFILILVEMIRRRRGGGEIL